MPRGYRCVVVAAVGWLALIGAAPKDGSSRQSNQAASQSASQRQLERIATALPELPQREAKDAGCKAGQDDRQSDLCAQWKAADAAAESAWWTAATFYAGLVGVGLGIGTLVAAWRAAHWAKEAAEHTKTGAVEAKRGADAATAANEMSLVPFVSIELMNPEKIMYDPISGRIGTRKIWIPFSKWGQIKRSPRILCEVKSTGTNPIIITGIYQHWHPWPAYDGYPPVIIPTTPGDEKELRTHLVVGSEGIKIRSYADEFSEGEPGDKVCFYGYIRFTDMQRQNEYLSGFYFELLDQKGMVAAMPPQNADGYWYHRKA